MPSSTRRGHLAYQDIVCVALNDHALLGDDAIWIGERKPLQIASLACMILADSPAGLRAALPPHWFFIANWNTWFCRRYCSNCSPSIPLRPAL
jgi:hypothetical protein